MKRTAQSISLLLVGLLLISSCSDEKTGNSQKQIEEKIEIDNDVFAEDTNSMDTAPFAEPKSVEPVPPPPPPPMPPEPGPWPPEPEPEPWPIDPPPPLPEPVPAPMSPNPIVDFPEVEASYPGGEAELMEFLAENIRYPQIDLEMDNQGRVILEFIVEKDGEITGVKILRGVSPTIDNEAKRVVGLMPNWKPGEADGKIARTKMRLPIKFSLN